MKKILLAVLIVITVIAQTACTTGDTPPAELPNPRPTLPPPVQPTEPVKPLTDQLSADAPVINYNDIKEGVIDEPGAADEWVFNAQAGERVNVVLNSQFDSYLELYNPDGELIASNDDSGDNLTAALFDVALNKTGPYGIIVRGYDGSMGNYALALTGGHPTQGGGLLSNGESRNAVLSDQGYKWRYQGQQGAFFTIDVKGAPGIDSFLALYGPDGTLLVSDDDSGGNLNPEIIDVQLPVDGLYTVRAHTIGATGLITLTVNESAQSSGGGPLTMGKGQLGTLKAGREHRWTFAGEAGQIINVNMVSPEFDTFLELRNSQDVILAENDDGPNDTNALIGNFALPASDTYTVVARSLSNAEGGTYELTVKPVKVAPGGGPLTPDKPVQASLAPEQTDTYTFDAQADSFITVRVESAQLDTYLELFGPDDTLLVGDDDSGGGLNAALLDFPVPADGEYRVAVKSARPENNQGGVYDILLTVTDDIAAAGGLETGQSVTRELAAGQQDTWTFEATEDSFVTIKMESDTLDTYLSLYDESGELLYVNDDFFAKQAAIANFIVPETGVYRVIARAYSPEEEGSYTISLEITNEELPLTPTSDSGAN
jgi:hypothetical protein